VPQTTLFLYGSLRRGLPSHDGQRVGSRSRFLGHDRIVGRLVDMGEWPALLASGRGIVHGELHLATDASLIADLDVFERALPDSPGGPLFDRIRLRTLGGYDVETYVWHAPVCDGRHVHHGDWKRRLEER
jgi:gamma-glutamylcyclotransferase (GGCT)/AIG2-like uncharacterized protein YtfP